MNKVVLVGRLTRDPDLRYTASNMATMHTAIAVDRNFVREGEERGADFINITAFGNRAETMKKYLTKGSQVAIFGRIQTGSYDDKDGKKIYTTDVIVEEFQFLDSKGSRTLDTGDNADNSTPYSFPNEGDSTTSETDPFADFGARVEVEQHDDDLPF